MPYKDIRYYLSTILLKIKATGYSIYYSNKYKKYFEQLWLKYFKDKNIPINASFDWHYYALSYYKHPDEFKRLYHFDNEMIPMCRKDFNPVFYNPINPAQYGLISFNHYLFHKDNESLIKASKMYQALLDKATIKDQTIWFPYNIDYPKFNLKAPWYAGITQAQILSLQLRIYSKAPTNDLKNQIEQVFNSLVLPVEEGGFLCRTEDGYVWLEEYPHVNKSFVLNGNMFCIISLMEYQFSFPDNNINKLIYQLTEGLLRSLYKYKRGNYWRYSLKNHTLSNIEYQGLYVYLFKHLWILTNNESFKILYEQGNKNMNWKAFYRFFGLMKRS
ncbi:MAG TPA: D-glucuronyl C5-epimerase family protein [Saprospiraceae bacterium]|nr:D-glucuronyl C5-epimerase family protein [Saprospiraceae bacterium]